MFTKKRMLIQFVAVLVLHTYARAYNMRMGGSMYHNAQQAGVAIYTVDRLVGWPTVRSVTQVHVCWLIEKTNETRL